MGKKELDLKIKPTSHRGQFVSDREIVALELSLKAVGMTEKSHHILTDKLLYEKFSVPP